MAAPNRPDLLALVAGTGTGVGKTWVSAAVVRLLAGAGVAIAARKPVQSYAPSDDETDADVLAAATGESPEQVCPRHRWYARPMAPPMAARALGAPRFTIDELASELAWPARTRVGLVETAGGVRSPLACDGDTVALTRRLEPGVVVLVADAGLGTINAVRLSADALRPAPVVVILNRLDTACELHRRNREWLAERDGLDVLTTASELAGHLRRLLPTRRAKVPESGA